MMEVTEDSREGDDEHAEEPAEYMLTESGDLIIDPNDADQRVDLVTHCFRCEAEALRTGHFDELDVEAGNEDDEPIPSGRVRAATSSGRSRLTLPVDFRLGVWVDVGARNFRRHGRAHFERLVQLGFTDVCFMVNDIPTGDTRFSLSSFPADELRRVVPELASRGIAVTLTSWVTPRLGYLEGLVSTLVPLASELGVTALEFDAEEAWSRRSPQGFADHTAAANHLFDGLAPLRTRPVRLGITTQVDPLSSERLRGLVNRADFVVPQAYSTMNPSWLSTPAAREAHAADIRSHQVNGPYGPVGIQRRAVARLHAASRGKPMIMGLAAYNRHRWGGHSAQDIMRRELDEAIHLRGEATLQGVRYWSWKWISGMDGSGGDPATSYAGDFFRGLQAGAARVPPDSRLYNQPVGGRAEPSEASPW